MIRTYDHLGRIKREIDPTQDNAYLHVSYVNEYPPYATVVDPATFVFADDVRRSPIDEMAVKTRAARRTGKRSGRSTTPVSDPHDASGANQP